MALETNIVTKIPALSVPSAFNVDSKETHTLRGRRVLRIGAATQPADRWKIIALAAIVVVPAIGFGFFWLSGRARPLTEKDTIVLADFVNSTRDPIFDDTLKQGLRTGLEQSPFLIVLSDQQVEEALHLMARQPRERLTTDLARELRVRTGCKAVLTGSISPIGTHYVIGLSAVSCHSGSQLATEQAESADKEHVLAALGASTSKIRKKLGESLSSIKRFDVPIEQATTSSLEALQAYSLGVKHLVAYQHKDAILHFRRAVELDPNFASAYMSLAHEHEWLGQGPLQYENAERAYARQGKWEEALKQGRLALELDPSINMNYYNLAVSELALGRVDAAMKTCDRATARGMNDAPIHLVRYWIAFVRHDAQEMNRQLTAVADLTGQSPNVESDLFLTKMGTALYFGKLAHARDLFRSAVESKLRSSDPRENAPRLDAFWAFLSAEFGNKVEARAYANRAFLQHRDLGVGARLALASARAGNIPEAEKSAAEFASNFHTWYALKHALPVARAAIALGRGDADEAIEQLRLITGDRQWWAADDPSSLDGLMDAYLRGQAYLQLHKGREAAAEFQRLIDHPGIVVNSPFGPLARVGLGRAYALQRDIVKSRAAYQDFFTLWKDADLDVPVLQQAKVEFAGLK